MAEGPPRGHDADCKRGSAVVSSHQSCGPDAHGHLAFRCLLAGRRLPRACDGAKLGRGEAVAPTVADRHRRAGRLTAEMGDGPPALGRAAAAERHVVLGGSLGGKGPPPCPFPLTLSDRTPTARLSCLWPGDDKLAHSALDREAPCSPRHARAAAHRSSRRCAQGVCLSPARPRSDAAGAAACCSLSPPATSANAAVTVNVLGPKASEGSLSKTNANKNERNETWSATGSLPAVAAAPSLGRGLRATRLARGSRPGSSCTARTAACGADSRGVCSGLRGPGLSGCS